MGVAAAGLVLQAFSSIKQAESQNKIAKYNAAVSEQEGVAAEKKAAFDESLHRERVRRAMSTQRAGIGASGVQTSGSALLGLEESAKQAELDALAIRHGGEVAKGRAGSTAAITRAQGKALQQAGTIRAGTSLLTASSKFKTGSGNA